MPDTPLSTDWRLRELRSILCALVLASCQLVLAAAVALHTRPGLIVAFGLSVLGFVTSVYYSVQGLRAPTQLIPSLVLLALYAAFVRYFGRMQRLTFDSEEESQGDEQN